MGTPTDHPLPTMARELLDPTTPVRFDERTYAWDVFGYADVLRIFSAAEVFSANFVPVDELPNHHPMAAGMWQADGRRHADLRALVAEPFRPRVLRSLEPLVRQTVEAQLDTVQADHIEIIGTVARPLPAVTICHILGVDTSHADRILRFFTDS